MILFSSSQLTFEAPAGQCAVVSFQPTKGEYFRYLRLYSLVLVRFPRCFHNSLKQLTGSLRTGSLARELGEREEKGDGGGGGRVERERENVPAGITINLEFLAYRFSMLKS